MEESKILSCAWMWSEGQGDTYVFPKEALLDFAKELLSISQQTEQQPEYDDEALFDALYKGQVAAEKAGMVNGTTQWGLCLLRHIRTALSSQEK